MGISTARCLAEATSCWLHHEYLCQRAGLFEESALKSVVGQVLSSFVLDKPARAWSGVHHPVLLKYAAGGSKAKLDFALAELAGSKMGKLRIVLECKWADSKHCSTETIIYDFFRLAILDRHLRAQGHPADCIFLLAGSKAGVKKVLTSQPFIGHQHMSLRQGVSTKANRTILDSTKHGEWASAFDAKASESARKAVAELGFPSITTTFNPGLPAISLGSDSINDQSLKFGCLSWTVQGF